MPTFDQNLVDLIDQRVRAGQARTRMVGTCVDRDTTGPGAQVIVDGDVFAVPVKVLGHVFLQDGHRCVLDKYGSDWIVTGSFAAFGLGESTYHNVGSTPESVTSSAYVDLAQVAPKTITKRFDGTYLRMAIKATAWVATTAGTQLRFGLRLTPTSGQAFTATDYNVTFLLYNVVSQHLVNAGWARNLGIPAGDYTWQVRWRRPAGTGTPTFDTGDEISVELDEGVRGVAPIL
jgi:hypothetical protein